MSYKVEKNGSDTDIVILGYEEGMFPSPHKGIASIKNANISTETGEVMAGYGREQQSQTNSTGQGTILPLDATTLQYTFNGVSLRAGIWINISSSTISGLSSGDYYIRFSDNNLTQLKLAPYYNGTALSGLGATGTATFTIKSGTNMAKPIAKAVEKYNSGAQTRYYVLDANGRVWVYDTATVDTSRGLTWFLPDFNVAQFGTPLPTGITVLNGWLLAFANYQIFCKPTVNLGGTTSTATTWVAFSGAELNNKNATHYAMTGHQGKAYYTDGNYIGSIFPNTSLDTGLNNVQSYCNYTASGVNGTIQTLIGGAFPRTKNASGTAARIPAVFFTDQAGTQPTNLTAGTIYYISCNAAGLFSVFAASSGGAAIDISTGAAGNQYFNTFFPTSSGGLATVTFSPQRVNLPYFEMSQCMAEVGNIVLIGCNGNVVYPWNQVDALPGGIIALPENNTSSILTVNQMAYIFAGNKGNIYISDGSTASMVIKVPDFVAGIPGTPNSYFEPTFTWGDTMYLRGRVYFSILDQTSTKAGSCGGIWSFYPTQNLAYGQDTGLALRIENQNSYGSYNGYATILLPNEVQTSISPQYWAGWQSAVTSPSYGIDYTASTPVGTTTIETDLIPVGTVLNKYTPKQIEYKLAVPLAAGESVGIEWRKNATDSYTSAGTAIKPDGATSLSGYFNANFQGAQWVQLRLTLTPLASASTSFVRLSQVRMR